MVRRTLLEYLTQPDPRYNVNPKAKPSTRPGIGVDIDGWDVWGDFDYENILRLFHDILHREYDFDPVSELEPAFHTVLDESSVEFADTKWNVSVVNNAMKAVAEYLKGVGSMDPSEGHLLWAKGSFAPTAENRKPHWGAIRSNDTDFDRRSLVAGETKMHPEGFPEAWARDDDEEDPKAKACLEQVLLYAALWKTRYAYILSPYELIVVRANSSPITAAQSSPIPETPSFQHVLISHSSPMPATLSRRNAATTPKQSPTPATPSQQQHQRRRSTATPTPTPTSQSSQGSIYEQSPATERIHNMGIPEVRVISRGLTGPNELCINIAMFVLLFLSDIDNSWGEKYEEIDEDPAYLGIRGLRG